MPLASESRNLNTGRLIPKPIHRTNYSIPRLSTLSGISRLHLSCLLPTRLPELPVQSICMFSPAPHLEINPVVITSPQLICPGLHTCLLLGASLGLIFRRFILFTLMTCPGSGLWFPVSYFLWPVDLRVRRVDSFLCSPEHSKHSGQSLQPLYGAVVHSLFIPAMRSNSQSLCPGRYARPG